MPDVGDVDEDGWTYVVYGEVLCYDRTLEDVHESIDMDELMKQQLLQMMRKQNRFICKPGAEVTTWKAHDDEYTDFYGNKVEAHWRHRVLLWVKEVA